MGVYRRLILPLTGLADAERAHAGMLMGMSLAQKWAIGRWALTQIAGKLPPQKPITLFNLTFPNPIGVAAGFDKDARIPSGLAALGFGHIEVGTLTPRPQIGNPKPRIFRLSEDEGLINRMGFPNGGAAATAARLQKSANQPRGFVLGVSLGKQKETPLAEAAADYVNVMEVVYPYSDYLVVNVSSPNTLGLRNLQSGAYLGQLLHRLCQSNRSLGERHLIKPRPLLIKIAPDLSWDELDEIFSAAAANGVAGIVAVNTTTSRSNLQSRHQQEKGGLSGAPLRVRALEIVRYAADHAGIPVIGVGGVQTADDVRAMLDAGASLVQIYAGIIYQGPRIAGDILRQLG